MHGFQYCVIFAADNQPLICLDMKKFTKTIAFAFMAMLAFSLTSCEDNEIARTLEGTWEGNMYAVSRYGGRDYFASYSQVCFLRDPGAFSSGDGYWVDYYDGNYWGGYNYIANHISWTVDFGTITIRFREDGYRVRIYNYSLNDAYFSGELEMSDGSRQRFSMRKVASPNWGGYHWGYSNYYYYSNGTTFDPNESDTNAVETKTGVTKTTETEIPQRIFKVKE